MKMKTLAAVLAALVCLTATAVMAENPHFVNSSASVQSDGTLLVTWKEAGLGNQVINYKLTATAQAVYGCVNPDQHPLQASSKKTVTAVVTTWAAFTASRNGNITASMVLEPPAAGTMNCGPGEIVMLGSVNFTVVDLWDMIMHVEEYMAGPYARVMAPF